MGRLFWKFFLSILLAQIVAAAGIGGAVWLKNRAAEQGRRLDIDMSPPAGMAIESAAATLEFGGAQALTRLLENMDRHRVFAVDERGKELLGRIVNPTVVNEARALLAQGDTRVVRRVMLPSGRHYLLFLPAQERNLNNADARPLLAGAGIPLGVGGPRREGGPPDGRTPVARPDQPRFTGGGPMGGPGQPGPGGPMGPEDRNPRFQPLTPFIPLAVAVAASLLFAALLAWYFSRPIRSLRQAFEAASQGDLAPRFAHVGGGRHDELTDLGHDFDRMTARLRSLMDGQTRLLHDVSHELRSPLARLQAAIGLAHQRPDRTAASLERIERESIRMDKLVGELLTLSRLEAGAIAVAKDEIDMAELLLQIVGDAQFEAASQGRTVLSHDIADVLLLGQPDLLARAIENVVRNAIKHSPEGGTVVVESVARDGMLRIGVLDQGPGVAPQDLQAIFEPFFRSSGTDKDVDGHGLGLAIARQVVQQHGGTITASNRAASNRAGGGLCVEIALPLD
ncbi:signal transduction histidine kinase [Pseudoduganella lurida]|uniref:histidine kinase n=1 Tax=Pseudoduganella lurida TaxID=1036180 RepID=A0A562RLP1_9BURK|nr:ATP-binding protein [Pseudoduganella lurida]TWI69360.1 signal transduction histidine kinase [Pseudoduganella lurida]